MGVRKNLCRDLKNSSQKSAVKFVDNAVAKYSPETVEKLEKLLCEVNSVLPPKQSLRLNPVRAKSTVFDSKLGGAPYMPKGMEYPVVREGECAGMPLYLLAQLNFEQLPAIEGFPKKGILQFFTGCENDDFCYGIDFDNYQSQNGFRIIYHSDIITDKSKLMPAEDMPKFEEYYLPFQGEFMLKPKCVEQSYVNPCVDGFDEEIVKAYNKLFGGNIVSVYGSERKNEIGLRMVDESLYDALYEVDYNNTRCRIGGYPFFTQSDPRPMREEYECCDVLLFQLDSEGDGDDEIMWGDCGVGNFFINADDLRKLDFSKVLYNWDCC